MTDEQIAEEAAEHGLVFTKKQISNARYQLAYRTSMSSETLGKSAQVYEYLKEYMKQFSKGPSSTTIASALSMSPGSVSAFMKTLKNRGLIDYSAGSYTGLKLLKKEGKMLPASKPNKPHQSTKHRRSTGAVQGVIFNFLRDFVAEHGHGPKRSQIVESLRHTVRADTISRTINRLKEQGRIDYPPKDIERMVILGETIAGHLPAAVRSNGHAPLAPTAPTYLGQLEADLTRKLGEAALTGTSDETFKEKTAAVRQVLDLLRGPAS